MSFDHQINRLEQQLAQDDAQMRALEEQFQAEAVRFFRQWWWEAAAQAVQGAPAVSQRNGPDGVAAMKARTSALRERAEAVVERHLGDPAIWWHKEPLHQRECTFRYVFRSQRVGPRPLDQGLRAVAGAIAPILLDFGYIEPARLAQWRPSEDADAYCYPYSLEWPPSLLKTARSYATRARLGANRLEDLRVVMARKGAGSLWG